MKTAAYWIERLGLQKHPEGGYFRETYRSDANIGQCCLGNNFEGRRNVSTAIYFLLEGLDFSGFHRIRSDEVWHHYEGCSVTIHVIDSDGNYLTLHLGKDSSEDRAPQVVVRAGSWFGATLDDRSSYALVGCTVSPGFDFRDFDLAERVNLIREHPQYRAVIERLTRR